MANEHNSTNDTNRTDAGSVPGYMSMLIEATFAMYKNLIPDASDKDRSDFRAALDKVARDLEGTDEEKTQAYGGICQAITETAERLQSEGTSAGGDAGTVRPADSTADSHKEKPESQR